MEHTEFVYEKHKYTLLFKEGRLYFVQVNKSGLSSFSFTQKAIPIVQVISTAIGTDRWKVDQTGNPLLSGSLFRRLTCETSRCYFLVINFWIKCKNQCWKLYAVKLKTANESHCSSWSRFINQKLSQALKYYGCVRPNKLLVFINPASGKKRAKQIYLTKVSRLFKLAEIDDTVITTQYPGHAKNHIDSNDVFIYDGVIVVGGDGFVHEVVNAILCAEQGKHDIQLHGKGVVHKKAIKYCKASIKLGVIPCGSGNMLSFSSQGVADVETATLQIVCGENHPINISSIYDQSGNFLRFSVLGGSFGYSSRIFSRSEQLRYFGSKRYIIGALAELVKLKVYAAEICYLRSNLDKPVDLTKEKSACKYPCTICLNNPSKGKKLQIVNTSQETEETLLSCAYSVDNNDLATNLSELNIEPVDSASTPMLSNECNDWQKARIRFNNLTLSNNSGTFEKRGHCFSPSAHLNDGTIDMAITHSTTRIGMARSVSVNSSSDHLRLPFVEAHRIKGFHLRFIDSKANEEISCRLDSNSIATDELPVEGDQTSQEKNSTTKIWSNDGEVTNYDNITVWVHKGLINLFARGIEDI